MRLHSVTNIKQLIGLSLLVISVVFTTIDFLTLQEFRYLYIYSPYHAIALIAFISSSYLLLHSGIQGKYIDFIYSIYALQLLAILFLWMYRINQFMLG